jgi:hypothetical protein
MARIHTTGDKITRHDNTITTGPAPQKVTIYEKATGKPHEHFAVDAREILAQPDSLYTASKEDLQPQQESNVTETLGATTFGIGERGRPLGAVSTTPDQGATSDKSADTGETEDTRTKDELLQAAEAKGFTVKSSATKADIQRLLELDGKTKAELAEMAESKGLESKGTKAELINLLAGVD